MVWNQLSIKSRLTALVLGTSLSSLLIAGILSWLQVRRAFQTQVFEHLTSVRASKGKQLEDYFSMLEGHIATLSEDQMIVSAMVELNSGYRELQNQAIADDWMTAIDGYYADDFLPALSKNVQSVQIAANYRPTSQAGQYLQYQYIVKNGTTNKIELDDAGDGSAYSRAHVRYHPLFRNLLVEFGYNDLYLINYTTGEVVYSTHKNVDYGTSLDRGPYRRSNLADVIASVRNDPGRRFVQVADYRPYVPTYSTPAAFYAAPIYNGPHIVGILAVQFPVARIRTILTGHQEWEQDGLGETGQVYVVGADFLMRSTDRSRLEAPDIYQERLERLGLSPQTLNLVETLDTSILLHPVETAATEAALAGNINTEIVSDYRGMSVLSSYAPLRLKGLRWAILAEMEQAEAFGPVTALQIYMGILGVILMLLIAWLANVAAHSFAQPIQTILEVAGRIRAGERDVDIDIGGDSKSGQLAEALQGVLQDLHAQETLTAEKEAANVALLENMMPVPMAARVRQEPLPIFDTVQQVTVLVARLTGLQELTTQGDPQTITDTLNRLITTFDDKARTYGLEPHLTLDNTYVATCGLAQVFLDHQERAVNFALDLVRLVESGQDGFPPTLDLQIGIHSGGAIAGVVGTANDRGKFMYKLWGNITTIALELNPAGGASNSILVSQSIRQQLSDRYFLVPSAPLRLPDIGTIPRWMVFTHTGQFERQISVVQTSFEKVLPHASITAEHFFNYLFERSPELTAILLGSMFKDEVLQQLEQHKKRFVDTVQMIVKGLDGVDQLVPNVQGWGRKYAGRGLESHHYETVGDALVWALEHTPDVNLSPETKQAWRFTYVFLQGIVEEAMDAEMSENIEAAQFVES